MTTRCPDPPRRRHSATPRWSREQIRAARQVALPPRLASRGLVLLERGGGNVEVALYKGLLIKASYWRWPERDLAGNAIDFYMKVLGLPFHEAMRELTAS